MNLSKLSALFFGAPAKTAGKRAVKFKAITRRFPISAGTTSAVNSIAITNGESHAIYVSIEHDFTKAGKK